MKNQESPNIGSVRGRERERKKKEMENQDPRGSPNKGRQGARGERDGEPRGSPNIGRQGDREWRTKRQTHTQMENHERERERKIDNQEDLLTSITFFVQNKFKSTHFQCFCMQGRFKLVQK